MYGQERKSQLKRAERVLSDTKKYCSNEYRIPTLQGGYWTVIITPYTKMILKDPMIKNKQFVSFKKGKIVFLRWQNSV
jgi:hypothetical protein